jgi:XisH protein
MARKDLIHDVVVASLKKAGWNITHDPLRLVFEDKPLAIDLGAELISADRGNQKIAVEIKSFINESSLSDFHVALGQYMNYRIALSKLQPERVLFLAISEEAYDDFFNSRFAQTVMLETRMNLIVCALRREELIQWIEY